MKHLATAAAILFVPMMLFAQSNFGVFRDAGDVGAVLHKGSTQYNSATQKYQLSGSGENIWFAKDEFQYAWKKVKGDFILQARGKLIGKGVDPHRKFGWMVRTNLDTGSPMAAATVHGDGLTSLQYRLKQDTDIAENKSAAVGPDVIRLERKGDKFTMSVAKWGELFTVTEVAEVPLGDEVYVGLFICSHNKDVLEQVSFDNVRIIFPAKDDFRPYRDYIGSYIETLDVGTGERIILHTAPVSLQAPNWTPDNKHLIYNSQGLIYRFDLRKKKIKELNTDFVRQNNNDHVLSFDGKMLGLSSSSGEQEFGSLIYTVKSKGGKPTRITPTGPSYLHGWSPDGKWLTYTAQRNNDYDIYKVPSTGGDEIRLTTSPGLDDGSEFSPDGQYIYFNSTRTGRMQLWRMKPDGSDQEQLTFDDFNNWFPHISPDGKSIVFISYPPEISPDDHPFYKRVMLRTMPAGGGTPKVIAYFYGGQGSINTPSWSPDSKKVAFISNSDITRN